MQGKGQATPRLKMSGIAKRFGPTAALSGVDLEVHAGQVHALIGENGAGKSTLMKILSGAYQADDGRMWIDGEAYLPKNPLQGRRHGVAMIYQELSLAQHLTVMENIVLGASRWPMSAWQICLWTLRLRSCRMPSSRWWKLPEVSPPAPAS